MRGGLINVKCERCNNRQLPSSAWLTLEVQVEGWPGIDTPVYLVLRSVTDWAIPTDFTIDNIRLVMQCDRPVSSALTTANKL
jgi:hypothetical protein